MKKLFDLLSVKQDIVITTHVNPDGDAIGSSLALYNFLIKYDHNVSVIVPNPYPDFLTWMKGNDDVVIYSNEKEKACSLVNNSSIIFLSESEMLLFLVTLLLQLFFIKEKTL